MKIYVGGRRTGKTTHMLTWLRYTPGAVMIVHSASEAARLEHENPDLAGKIFSPHMAADGRLRGMRDITIGIDNLDLILPYLFGGRIGPVTVTEEEDEDLLYQKTKRVP